MHKYKSIAYILSGVLLVGGAALAGREPTSDSPEVISSLDIDSTPEYRYTGPPVEGQPGWVVIGAAVIGLVGTALPLWVKLQDSERKLKQEQDAKIEQLYGRIVESSNSVQEELRREIVEQEQALKDLQEKLSNRENEVAFLQAEVSKNKVEIEALRSSKREQEDQIQSQRERIAYLERELENIKNSKEAAINRLREALEQSGRELGEAVIANQKLVDRVAALESRLKTYQEVFKTIGTAVSTIRDVRARDIILQAMRQIATLEQE